MTINKQRIKSLIICSGMYKGIFVCNSIIPPIFWRTSDGLEWERTGKIQKGWGNDKKIVAYFYKIVRSFADFRNLEFNNKEAL